MDIHKDKWLVIILRGGSGCGKTTWANSQGNFSIYSADDYFIDPNSGEYRFDLDLIGDAHAHCLKSFANAVRLNESSRIIVDNTNTRVAEFSPYAALAAAYGYSVDIFTFVYDPVKAYKRSAHGVPLKECMNQYYRLIDETKNIPRWWNHDYILSDI